MEAKDIGRGIRFLMLAAAFAAFFPRARAQGAQPVAETSDETGMQLDFHVPAVALKAYLPPGWTSNVAPQGPAKDANLRVIFMDRETISGPDGKPVGDTGSDRLVTLVAPVKDPSGAPVQLVIGGLTDNSADVPGPFGNYVLASTSRMRRSYSASGGSVVASQDWLFVSPTGERIEMQIQYARSAGNVYNGTAPVKYCSAKTPTLCQTIRQEMNLKILRNATTNPPDRVKRFSFKASGGTYSKLFDGTQKTLSWDNIVWVHRSTTQP